jgi:hypothetical protein
MEFCLMPVTALVEQFRVIWEVSGGADVELEARLGRYDTRARTFHADVNPLCFKDAERCLDKCEYWVRVRDWWEEKDVFLPDGVRQRVDASGPAVAVTSVRKERVAAEVLLCTGARAAVSSDCGMDVRVALAREHPVTRHDLVPCQPAHVRIKQRKSYELAHWRFDLTRVWAGPTNLDAEARQRAEAPRYEIELELINPDGLFRDRSSAYIAESLLLKLRDFVRIIAKDAGLEYAAHPQ